MMPHSWITESGLLWNHKPQHISVEKGIDMKRRETGTGTYQERYISGGVSVPVKDEWKK